MTGLLEIREKLKLFYSKYELFILPVLKFLLAFITLNTLNGRLGYMVQLDNVAAVLIVALLCSFLPVGALVFFSALFSLAHMYALSLETALVGLCVYLLMFLLFFRFSPRGTLVVVVTPLLCAMNIPYVIPIAAGLLCGPASALSVGCGVGIHCLFDTVRENAPNIKTMSEEDMLAKVRLLIDGLAGKKGMLVMIAAFAVTVLVVYLIRKMSIAHSWTIAIIAGGMTDVVILLIGDLIYDINVSVPQVLFGSLFGILLGKIIEFFRFCVDYSRTEKVQFEDDEYYYYVKAIPKMTVSVSTKTVKRINSQTYAQPQHSREADVRGRAAAGHTVPPSRTSQRPYPSGRSVVTERTVSAKEGYGAGARIQGRSGDYRAGRSVTVRNSSAGENKSVEDDYEDLF